MITSLSTLKTFLKTKIKYHGDEVTDFYDKEIPKVDSNYTPLAVISLDSVHNKDRNNYPQVFLRECKYIEKKVIKHVNDNLSYFSSSDESHVRSVKKLGLCFKKYSTLFLEWATYTKNACCIFKTMFTMH